MTLTPLQRWIATVVVTIVSGALAYLPIPAQFKGLISMGLTMLSVFGITAPKWPVALKD